MAAPITPPNLAQVASVADADLMVAWPTASVGPLSGVAYSVIRLQITANIKLLSIFGSGAGAAITSGAGNVALGPSALAAETTGNNNVAVGNGALVVQNGGTNNVAIGPSAGLSNTNGPNNIMIGQGAGSANTSGGQNIYVGQLAGGGNTTGSNNTWIGGNASGYGAAGINASATVTIATGDGHIAAQQNNGWIAGNLGLVGPGPTGGFKGDGTWNVSSGFFINGVPAGTLMQVGKLLGANMNSTADQAIALTGPALFTVDSVVITNASTSLTTAQGGFYTAAAKGGSLLFGSSATSAYSYLTAASKSISGGGSGNVLPAQSGQSVTMAASGSIFFALTTPQGGAATADIYVFGRKLT